MNKNILTMNKLPIELQNYIYTMSNTYKDIFNRVLQQLKIKKGRCDFGGCGFQMDIPDYERIGYLPISLTSKMPSYWFYGYECINRFIYTAIIRNKIYDELDDDDNEDYIISPDINEIENHINQIVNEYVCAELDEDEKYEILKYYGYECAVKTYISEIGDFPDELDTLISFILYKYVEEDEEIQQFKSKIIGN